jgi:hypothetical protein
MVQHSGLPGGKLAVPHPVMYFFNQKGYVEPAFDSRPRVPGAVPFRFTHLARNLGHEQPPSPP